MAGVGNDVFEQLWSANQRFVDGFDAGNRSRQPARRLAVLTCMDARVDPSALFALEIGDAAVVRNAGGRATPDAIRSLVLATWLLGVDRIVVLHHTDCALAGQDEATVQTRLAGAGAAGTEAWEFLAMPDPDGALRSDVVALRDSPILPKEIEVEGWRYDVATGRVATVVDASG